MTAEKPITGILVTLDIADRQALFIMLASDGAINRMGSGSVTINRMGSASVNKTDRIMFIGCTSLELFEGLRQRVGADLLRWIGEYADPSPRGELCRLTVGFQHDDGSESMSRWQYGAESQGPAPEVRGFVRAALESTDPWFQKQKLMAQPKWKRVLRTLFAPK